MMTGILFKTLHFCLLTVSFHTKLVWSAAQLCCFFLNSRLFPTAPNDFSGKGMGLTVKQTSRHLKFDMQPPGFIPEDILWKKSEFLR